MAESNAEFQHRLAIKIAREISLPTVNDLLARRLIDLVRSNSPSFSSGKAPAGGDFAAFAKGARTFGKFRDEVLQEIWDEVRGREWGSQAVDLGADASAGQTNGLMSGAGTFTGIPSMVIQDQDVLNPAAPVQGGLARPGLMTGGTEGKHVFKAPATPRSSALGLDRLAMEKRREAQEKEEREAKRARLSRAAEEDHQADGDSAFKSAYLRLLPGGNR